MIVKIKKGATESTMGQIITLIDSLDRPGGHNLITIFMIMMVPVFYHMAPELGNTLFTSALTLLGRNMVGATLTAAKDRLLTEAAKNGTGNGTTTLTDTTTVTEGKEQPK